MSSELKAKEDPTYENLGYDPFLNRSIQSSDPNYKTSEEWDQMTEDATIGSAKMGGITYVKTLIVRDTANIDRVLIGFSENGF